MANDGIPYVDHILRVRFAETDLQGIVYYANYLIWFEVARMEWMRANNITWETLQGTDHSMVIAHAELDYHASAHYDEEIRVRTFVERVGRKSFTLGFTVSRLPEETLLVTGRKVLVCIDNEGNSAPLPDLIREPLERDLAAREALRAETPSG